MNKTGGHLKCPKCFNNGMNDYNIWESKCSYDNKELFIFYSKENKSKKWKCWSLLSYCGCTVHQWYDPWGICDKCCKNDTIKNLPRNDDKDKDSSSSLLACAIAIMVAIFIFEIYFILYFFFCIWFDLYWAFCNKDKVRRVWDGDEVLTIDENDNIWKKEFDIKYLNKYTEEYWVNNFLGLFRCKKCNYSANSFKEFIENVIVDVNNNSTNVMNTTNINTQLGDMIKVEFSVGKEQTIKIQSNINDLFSKVINSLFQKIPEYKNKNCIFIYNNNIMKQNLTLAQNGYNGGEISLFNQ